MHGRCANQMAYFCELIIASRGPDPGSHTLKTCARCLGKASNRFQESAVSMTLLKTNSPAVLHHQLVIIFTISL